MPSPAPTLLLPFLALLPAYLDQKIVAPNLTAGIHVQMIPFSIAHSNNEVLIIIQVEKHVLM